MYPYFQASCQFCFSQYIEFEGEIFFKYFIDQDV